MANTYEVCPRCHGEGTIVNPVLSVWTEEDRERDPEAFEDMRRGVYDVVCVMCDGLRGVRPADIERYREAKADLRLAAAENGDWDGYQAAGKF